MRKNIIPILMCPKCKGDFSIKREKQSRGRIEKGILKCNKCHSSFQIIDDIICLFPSSKKESKEYIAKTRKRLLNQERKNIWLKYISQEETFSLKDEWKWLINNLNLRNSKIHLEWAVGSGRFLRNILKIVPGEIIVIDKGYADCVGLRDLLKKTRGYSKITIIWGDARQISFIDNSIESANSWHGLDEPGIEKALDESIRVLKKNKKLGVSGVFFKEKSKSLIRALKYKIHFAKKDQALKYLKKLGFKDIKQKTFFKGIWGESASFLPIKGDGYTSYAIVGKK